MAKEIKRINETDPKQNFDEVLRRMLSTPPPKPKPKKQQKKTGQ